MKFFILKCFFLISLFQSLFAISWNNAQAISLTRASLSVLRMQVAMNSRGDTIAIWQQANVPSTDRFIQYAYCPYGGSWSTPKQISTPGFVATDPQVAINDAGQAVAVWQLVDPPAYIEGVYFNAGEIASPNFKIADPNQILYDPELRMNEAGQIVILWHGLFPAGTYATFAMWGQTEFDYQIISQPGVSCVSGRVAIDESGKSVALWRTLNGNEVLSAFANFNQSWSAPQIISTPNVTSFIPTIDGNSIEMDAQGNAAAIWLESPSGIRIVTSAFFSTATSKWSTPNYISNGTSAAQDPTISVSPQGDIFVVWTETSAPVTTLYGRSYRQNGWSSIYTIASGTLGPRGSVGLDGYGRAIIAWSQFDSFFSRNDIYATYYENQNFSSPQILSNLGSGSATVPRIAVNPMGYGWVLWEFFVTSVGEFVQGASSINPVNFFGGEQIFNQTSFQSSYNNTLFWSASPSPTTGYKIYRNGELLSELPLLSREYVDPAQNKKASTIYSITTVTPLQKESEAVSVTLP